MEIKELNETIKVAVIFQGDKILPKWFVWEGRKYITKEINYAWSDREGNEKIHCFSVTDGANNYEISFHPGKTLWRLNKVYG